MLVEQNQINNEFPEFEFKIIFFNYLLVSCYMIS